MLLNGALFLETRKSQQDEDTESLKPHFYLLRRCWNSVVRETSFLLVDGNRDRQLDIMISREEKGRGPPKEHISE